MEGCLTTCNEYLRYDSLGMRVLDTERATFHRASILEGWLHSKGTLDISKNISSVQYQIIFALTGGPLYGNQCRDTQFGEDS